MTQQGLKSSSLPKLNKEERQRYDRQIRLSHCGEVGQRRLKSSTVVVVGAGGLGSAVLMSLVAAGVGRVIFFEFDHVSLSNLHRQYLYTTHDIGQSKAQVAQKRLAAINPLVEIQAISEPLSSHTDPELISSAHLMIDCTDRLSARSLISTYSSRFMIPHCYASVNGIEGQLALFMPGGPCFSCLFPSLPQGGVIQSCDQAGVLGAIPQLIGGMQAALALNYLINPDAHHPHMDTQVPRECRITHYTSGAQLSFTLSQRDDCPQCHPMSGRLDLPTQHSVIPISPTGVVQRWSQGWSPKLIDVRTESEYETKRIRGAILLPLSRLEQIKDATLIPEWLQAILYSEALLIYCERGPRAERAAVILNDLKYSLGAITHPVYELTGGLSSWAESGFDLDLSSNMGR